MRLAVTKKDDETTLIDLTQELLDSVAEADWATYQKLCDPTLSAFEPEGRGHLIEGMDFHRYYFDLGPSDNPRNTTIASPHVRMMGDVAIVSYVRLVQWIAEAGVPSTASYEETRVWERQGSTWRHVHFHRSRADSP
jgi:ketosteroid isomerase-like protein